MIVPWFAELDPNEESKTQQKLKTLFTRKMVGGEESNQKFMKNCNYISALITFEQKNIRPKSIKLRSSRNFL